MVKDEEDVAGITGIPGTGKAGKKPGKTTPSYLDKDGNTVDFNKRVKLKATDKALFHNKDKVFEAGLVLANKMVADGHAELVKE